MEILEQVSWREVLDNLVHVGGGSIIEERGSVSGTATAARIRNTGAIGAAVAWQRCEIAIALSLVNFLLLRYGARAKGGLSSSEGR